MVFLFQKLVSTYFSHLNFLSLIFADLTSCKYRNMVEGGRSYFEDICQREFTNLDSSMGGLYTEYANFVFQDNAIHRFLFRSDHHLSTQQDYLPRF